MACCSAGKGICQGLSPGAVKTCLQSYSVRLVRGNHENGISCSCADPHSGNTKHLDIVRCSPLRILIALRPEEVLFNFSPTCGGNFSRRRNSRSLNSWDLEQNRRSLPTGKKKEIVAFQPCIKKSSRCPGRGDVRIRGLQMLLFCYARGVSIAVFSSARFRHTTPSRKHHASRSGRQMTRGFFLTHNDGRRKKSELLVLRQND
ncbi:hypothetical protein CEXT_285801 [Caerostris extrusa]|uniref:Serine/threonine specific protein phosphatases domain-containing protein n=1 Tax=Caerostris extrusa TaxID=172846 RepID=A0AAV4V0H4_CAEEX|nr:hypothetical protein CEXT_285801 [Caerostris extrusa]